ncbi:MAG: ABC transporter ATP-binding protein [Verrucomicrobia bacterium]|nr:ABC transporter ATP-binding protein [Verrucomicrobiota bacterium]MDA1087473.1 ABC transporter ATP-binding protein [Verrucomicrobiota bacterium]
MLAIRELRTYFGSHERPIRAVDGISLTVAKGQLVALVGESGCGKSVTALSLCRLLPEPPAFFAGGSIEFDGKDVLTMKGAELRRLRGGGIAYVFQEPGASLNPVLRVGPQVREAVELHQPGTDATAEVERLLSDVGIHDPARTASAYPHELSGGMQQRAMIAMALACRPKLLVADEPTTALDVTIEAQIIDLLVDLQKKYAMGVLLITHNLGIVARAAEIVHVMYAGRIVESGSVEEILTAPSHPYTRGLLDAVPAVHGDRTVRPIDGNVPHPASFPSGCRFHPRCPRADAVCRSEMPELSSRYAARSAACHFPLVD